MKAEDTFRSKVAPYMARLMKRFDLTADDAAAVFGNAGHESLGLTVLQEIKPTVPGSRGGYGWFQWTGPRRRDYEAFCKAGGMDPASDEANYAFLEHELLSTERLAIPKLKAATGMEAKVIAFENGYERAGVKHYDSRLRWARLALEAFTAAKVSPAPAPVPPAIPVPPPVPVPQIPPAPPVPPLPDVGAIIAKWLIGAIGLIFAALGAWLTVGGK